MIFKKECLIYFHYVLCLRLFFVFFLVLCALCVSSSFYFIFFRCRTKRNIGPKTKSIPHSMGFFSYFFFFLGFGLEFNERFKVLSFSIGKNNCLKTRLIPSVCCGSTYIYARTHTNSRGVRRYTDTYTFSLTISYKITGWWSARLSVYPVGWIQPVQLAVYEFIYRTAQQRQVSERASERERQKERHAIERCVYKNQQPTEYCGQFVLWFIVYLVLPIKEL